LGTELLIKMPGIKYFRGLDSTTHGNCYDALEAHRLSKVKHHGRAPLMRLQLWHRSLTSLSLETGNMVVSDRSGGKLVVNLHSPWGLRDLRRPE
jgi:hypothetical protein